MLLIYLPKNTTRCDYVFDLIFKQELGIEYLTTTDIEVYQGHREEKMNYSDLRKGNELFIKSGTLLFGNEIKKESIEVAEKQATKILFPNKDDDLGFDIFAAVFYMVSRYEEYLPFTSDQFGRYKAEDSLAFQNSFLQTPVVNTWIHILKNVLQQRFPSLKIQSSIYNAIVTYDIDVAYKYRGRSWARTMGSALKDIVSFKMKDIIIRKKTLLNIQKDPWDVYDGLRETILENKLKSVFFFLLANKAEHDRNLNYKNPLMKELIGKIESFSEIGIHPSFQTSSAPEKIAIEKNRLENLSGKKINKSRQHYLKFNLPDTYNSLLEAGITQDYSMGFPGMAGFRAGTCNPFYFYDLKNERITNLQIFPVTLMEGSFSNLKISPEETLLQILDLIKQVKNVGGTFISIWHNHTISETIEYRRWKEVHDKMIQSIIANGA
ncbi:MAG: polysaccharide deacetylase family protein [Ginsengibacter sp.]